MGKYRKTARESLGTLSNQEDGRKYRYSDGKRYDTVLSMVKESELFKRIRKLYSWSGGCMTSFKTVINMLHL